MKTRTLNRVSLIALIFLVAMMAVVYLERPAPPDFAPPVITYTGPYDIRTQIPGVHEMQRPGPLHPEAVIVQDPTPPEPWVSVDWSLKVDPETKALYEQMATLVSGYTAIPNDRLNYFAAVNNANNYTIDSWGGMLTNVQAAPLGGYLLTVKVAPRLTTTVSQATTLYWNYLEQFSVDVNNNVQYVGFLDPENGAGKLPAISANP